MNFFSLPVRIVGAAMVLIAGLCGVLVNESVQRAQGTEVVLRVRGVDPRNLLTGHFVALRFAEALPAGAVCPPGVNDLGNGGQKGIKPWLALKTSGEFARVVGVGATREAAKAFAPVVVQGSASCVFDTPDGPKDLGADIGIERFHASQKDAEALQLALRDSTDDTPHLAIVSIGKDGRARLKGLKINGMSYDLAWW